MAIVAQGRKGRAGVFGEGSEKGEGRIYVSPNASHATVAASAKPVWEPDGDLELKALGFRVPEYGFTRWADLRTPRQLVALTTFSDLAAEARAKVQVDAGATGLHSDSRPLADGGCGVRAYSETIAAYLALGVGRLADASASLCQWGPAVGQTQHVFQRQALSMIWDFAESNAFAGAAGDYLTSVRSLARVIERLSLAVSGEALQLAAQDVNETFS
jgi:putative DNA methylase